LKRDVRVFHRGTPHNQRGGSERPAVSPKSPGSAGERNKLAREKGTSSGIFRRERSRSRKKMIESSSIKRMTTKEPEIV